MTEADVIFVPADYFRHARLEEIFPDTSRPLEIDLGCGDGAFLEEMAALHPERNFLGVERLVGRIHKTAKRIIARGLTNARVLRLENSYTVGWLLPSQSVSRLHLLCPDPWPKHAHLHNRIVNDADFLTGLQRVLVDGGEFLMKSDDEHFFENTLASISAIAGFERLDWPEGAFVYPQTSFERQWLSAGRIIHRARWRWRS